MESRIFVKSYNDGAVRSWDDSFPLGNGRLGAMEPGLPCSEAISLNEDSLWYGNHQQRLNPDAYKHLEEIRNLLKQGKVKEADKLCYTSMSSIPKYFGAYEPMGELYLFFNHGNKVSSYERVLDLQTAVASISYSVDGMKIYRESFVSNPHQVMVFRITADKQMLDIHTNLMRRPCDMGTDVIDDNILHMKGQCGPDGVKFDCVMSAKTDGEMSRIGDFLSFKNASEIVLYIASNSDFYEKNPLEKSLEQLKKAMELDYNSLKNKHIEDYQALYNRVEIDFETDCEDSLDVRLENVRNGKKDTGLLELFFNFGRYLMISASRQGTQPMNLQGIWNRTFAAPWECNYTININTEMNYWIAETSQLSECHEPLFDLIERMIPNGEKTAKEIYNCDGFVAHHATNLWGDTAIEGISYPSSVWPMGGAWLALHMWEHYVYTQDIEFLKERAMPVLQKSALFFTQYLTEAEDGCYITGPSLSPENIYLNFDGTQGKACMAPEMDNQILRALFRSLVKSCELLGICDEKYEKYKLYLSKIRPTRINKNGGIMEWDKDYDEVEPGHRHISPLFGLCPDNQITPDKTPELARACQITLERRIDNTAHGTFMGMFGWNAAWASACYLRLGLPEKALDTLYILLRTKGAISDSLLNKLPVYQIDGNFGIAFVVTEMLLRSDEERIFLLPALPENLKSGSFKGLAARGGFIIDAKWENGNIKEASVKSISGNVCRIKCSGVVGVNTEFKKEDEFIVFSTSKDEVYQLNIKIGETDGKDY